jgi:hypothetical protein
MKVSSQDNRSFEVLANSENQKTQVLHFAKFRFFLVLKIQTTQVEEL